MEGYRNRIFGITYLGIGIKKFKLKFDIFSEFEKCEGRGNELWDFWKQFAICMLIIR